jgi:hypothetical protein
MSIAYRVLLRAQWLVVACLLVFSLTRLECHAQKSVSVQLHARWPGTPLALEILEFMVRSS